MTERTCSVPGCEKKHLARGLCSTHYNRAQYQRMKATGWRSSRPRLPQRTVACAECGSDFQSARSNARFCSRRCGRRWELKHEQGECAAPECTRPVRAKGLCANHYKIKLRAEGREKPFVWTDKRRDHYHRRRALKKAGATGSPVIREVIAARDGYRCGLCGKRVNMTRQWPHPLSPSLDHLVPLSRGGAHDPANVQLAHLRCNSAKNNRACGEQLMLIG